ncbi:MAG: xanthine dehydrogenase family protein molybdopterin-binding subunit [Alphaproteobacteria bacterium]|nr:xanthine dehydrogenase family protein molybdopterin-binding subunit [Alphaproteobacteria bacterium]
MPEGASAAAIEGIGVARPRIEDERLLRGRGRYVGDIALPGMLRAFVLRSPYAHAEMVSIDTSAARALPGVLAVLTGAELAADGIGGIPWEVRPPQKKPPPILPPEGDPAVAPPQPALAQGRVRYVGEPVALIVAETEAIARDSAELVAVEFRELPALHSAVAARQPGAAALWPRFPGNLCFVNEKGDRDATDAAFARAAHVVTLTLTNQRLAPSPIETRAYLGAFDAASGRFTLYANAGKPHPIRHTLAKFVFKLPDSAVHVIAPDIGGGFGGKNVLYPEEILVLWAARRIGRPVRWIQDRSEAFLSDMHGRDQVDRASLALDSAGKVLGLRVEAIANLGAYLAPRAVIPTTGVLKLATGVYDIPAAHVSIEAAFSNTVPTCPYRGAGHPEAIYIVERLMDLAAIRLGMDPAVLRRQNLVPAAAMPYKTALGVTYDTGDFPANMARAEALAAAAGFPARRAASAAAGRLRGLGIANCIEMCGSGFGEAAELRAETDGSITVLIGTMSSGQSHATVYGQVVASALDIPASRVAVVQGDTDRIATGNGTGACRSLTVGGAAILRTAEALVAAGRPIAAGLLEVAAEDLSYAGGHYTVSGTDRRVSLAQVAAAAAQSGQPLGASERFKPDDGTFPAGTHAAEVEVDPETGAVQLLAYTIVHDAGVVVNPTVVAGQLHGGVAQGIGQAMLESARYDPESAQVLAASFMDYAMPRADDLPSFGYALNATPTAINPLGAKSIGEAGPTAAPPAIMGAILDALAPLGVEHLDMPATPHTVWRAIRAAAADRR